MSANANESGDFEEFFQPRGENADSDASTTAKPEPTHESEDWVAPPITAEVRARQLRLRRLVLAIVAPLTGACVLILAHRPWRAPPLEASTPAPLGVSVGAARPLPLPELGTATSSTQPESPQPSAIAQAAAPTEPAELVSPLASPLPSAAPGSDGHPGVLQSEEQGTRPARKLAQVTARRRVALETRVPAPDMAPRSTTSSLPSASFPLE